MTLNLKPLKKQSNNLAQVGLACAEKDGPYRGAGFYIKFNGIEKIYSAHRDTGHGYGIEIKIK